MVTATTTPDVPVLYPATAHNIFLALYGDLRTRLDAVTDELCDPTHEAVAERFTLDLYTAAQVTVGTMWLDEVSEAWTRAHRPLKKHHGVENRLQISTAYDIINALRDDLRARHVPSQFIETHLTDDLESKAQLVSPFDWFMAVGGAWAATLREGDSASYSVSGVGASGV